MLQKVPLGRKDTVRLPHVQAQIKRGGALDADAMDSDVKPPAGMLDDLHFSDGAPHAEGSAAAAAAAAARAAADGSTETGFGGILNLDSRLVGGFAEAPALLGGLGTPVAASAL